MMNENIKIIETIESLIEETIFRRPEEEVLQEIEKNTDLSFEKNLSFVKRMNAKTKASLQQQFTDKARRLLSDFISQIGQSNIANHLLMQPKYSELNQQFFSKYSDITSEDKESMLTDSKLMDLIEELKKDIEDEENTNR